MILTRNKSLGNKVFRTCITRPSENNVLLGKSRFNGEQNMSTVIGFKAISKKAKQQYATDGSGEHTIGTQAICDKPNCETKFCRYVCGELVEYRFKGHATHKPINKNNDYLSNKDFNGVTKDQYVQRPNTEKKVSPDELSDLTEKDLKGNKKATDFFNSTLDIFNKITK